MEGSSDYFVQRAISDYYDGWLEKHNIVLVNCGGKNSIPIQADLHQRYGIPYHCMADSDYTGNMANVTRLEVDLEAELEKIGVECVKNKESDYVYGKMMDFLIKSHDEKWKESGIWLAFEAAVLNAECRVPSQQDAVLE